VKKAYFRTPLCGTRKVARPREAGKAGLFFLFLGFVFLGGAIFWGGRLITALSPKKAASALEVNTLPKSRVFLDGKELGETPFKNEKFLPGEYTLSLLPEGTASFSSWERKISLNPRLLTYINYIFGPTERESAGEILTLEKIDKGKGEIIFLSDPDGASFSLDGEDQGTTPKVLSGFENGEHQIGFSFPGYHKRSFTIKTWASHKLLVNVKLAGIVEEIPPQASMSAVSKVKILETPTGWLRVRVDPSLSASETAKVKPGEEYLLVEEQGEWFKIQYEEGKAGWVTVEYAQKLE